MPNAVQNPFVAAQARGGSQQQPRRPGQAPRPGQGRPVAAARVVPQGHARVASAPSVAGTPPWMPALGAGQVLSSGAPAPMSFQAGVQGYPQQQVPNVYGQPQGYPQQAFNPAPQSFMTQGNLQHFASRHDELVYDDQGNWNPQRMSPGGHGWAQTLRQAGLTSDPNERAFARMSDGRFEINAYSNKEALQQAAMVLQHSTRIHREAQAQRQLTPQQRFAQQEILKAAMQDQQGFHLMGQELLLPIKDLVDYEGFARRLYRVRNLQQGEYFRITKDVRATAWVIGQDGQGIESRVYGRYVTPSEFKIGSFPTVDIQDVYQANYDLLDRAQDTARQEIELEEDKRGLALIDTASTTVNTQVTYVTLGVGAFEDVRYQVERHRLVVDKFVINRAELSDVIKNMSAAVDPVTERELILAGYIGSFLNAMIVTAAGTGVEEVVPAGTFYAITSPEYMGEMGIRTELFSEPFNMFNQQRFVKGWAIGEILGFVIPNPRSCAKGVK